MYGAFGETVLAVMVAPATLTGKRADWWFRVRVSCIADIEGTRPEQPGLSEIAVPPEA
jgi:hypothetical protein